MLVIIPQQTLFVPTVTARLPVSLPVTTSLVNINRLVLPVSAPRVFPYPPAAVKLSLRVQPLGVDTVPPLAVLGFWPTIRTRQSPEEIPVGYAGDTLVPV